MAATLHQASEVTNSEPELSQLPNTRYLSRLDNRGLEDRARQLGTAVGRAVAALRNTGTRIRDSGARFKDTASQATDATASPIAGMKREIRTGYKDTKTVVQNWVRDCPLQVVLCAAALGLALGAGMRIWRASR